MLHNPEQDFVLKTIESRDVHFVRFWFTDVLGNMKSFAVVPGELERAFEDGMGFDGSCIEGFADAQESDMLAFPDPSKNIEKRWKYISLAIENKWDKRFLKTQIKENVADKYGAMPSNFGVTIKDSRDAIKALNMFKDEYLLDFINTEEIGIRDLADIDERVVEQEIIHNIKKFIMTFGRDFAFV